MSRSKEGTMELRSSRSRSKTPFSSTEGEFLQNEINYSHSAATTGTRITRSTKLRTVESHDEVTMKSSSRRSTRNNKHVKYITSDYSSEDGEAEVTSTYADNQTNHALESSHHRHRQRHEEMNGSDLLALKMYREAKEYWIRYPKTDYTYSPNSKDRVELAPGVVNMPNMSRKSIHNASFLEADVMHKETNTEFTLLEQEHGGLKPRALFTSPASANNNHYFVSKSTRSVTISIFTRMFLFVQRVFWFLGKPVEVANSLVLRATSALHRLASQLMMLDTWLLRGQTSDNYRQQHHHSESGSSSSKKLRGLFGLCLIPLLLFGGMWLLSALGHAVNHMAPTIIPLFMAANATSSKVHVAPVGTGASSETIIKIQLDAPIRTGLSDVQLRLVAQSVKDNLNLDLDVETIMMGLMRDSNVQRLDESSPSDIAAALTKEQIAAITNNLNYYQKQDVNEIIEKVLESPSIQNIIDNYNVNNQIVEQEKVIEQLQEQIDKLRLDLNAALFANSAKYAQLTHSIKRCCHLNALQMERHLNGLIAAILNSKEHKDNLSQWLGAMFVAQNELESKLNIATEKLNKRFDDLIASTAQKLMADVSMQLAGRVTNVEGTQMPPNEQQIRAIVKQSLAIYDADKTGLVDYALESAGGQILSTRCTEHYSARTSVVSIFGIPLWYPSATPRTVITPGVVPGECWAFQSFPGFIIVKLSHNVTIEAFSYEHVSRHLTPSGRIDSAPKDIQMFGLHHEFDREPVLLGEYRYDAVGDELQFFPVIETQFRSFQIVELKVNSNHGNPNYTCLYRFRVHGKLAT